MKFLIKSLLIITFLTGFYLCTYENIFSESIHLLTFYSQNFKDYISNILLQNKNINNTLEETNTKSLLNEYFITIFNECHMNDNFKENINSSNFKILNLNNEKVSNIDNISNFSGKNFCVLNSPEDYENIENFKINNQTYKLFNYDNYSISYINPKLLTNKDLLDLYKYLSVFEKNFYTSVIFLNKNDAKEKLISQILNKYRIIITLGDEFVVKDFKNFPLITLGKLNDVNLLYQINLFISDYAIKKIKIKLFPTNEHGITLSHEKIQEVLNNLIENSELKFHMSENGDYIYSEYDILKK
ncbi:hypothetical protein [Candidatus Arthromitus sp. SFB-rat-Yit]|uniref:hypothetical protein n=1 Tax=Candidatus Arthromitus sp. SFB-rat-Yit TaxID=1041504 RepID=UPI000227A581|nr:hypothetical protein [Candidatus Arthromitus sp. SFB-rat-Yit]BAK81629.1 hypothetical protein BDU_804 [Candidatus Arthromitus sp. SFB-rat-Yit]